jgi:deoxyribodipyrimidine photo-lyase
MNRDFPPTRAAALERLRAFEPLMGRAYAAGRNRDRGPDGVHAVSILSPYVRHRLVLEQELVDAARAAHGDEARSFVDEVMWRSYWKGWLEHRPEIWRRYRDAVRRGRDDLATQGGLRRVFHDATEGRTGIACFDAWARELVATNWLHNHARMWFASIWIFTLRLPWALGAEFFLRHLLDGDPASNTLSWRWVAGLHTIGKCYVARAENIARHTDGRFNPAGELDEAPEPLTENEALPAPRLPGADAMPDGRFALLLHDEDCLPETLGLPPERIAALAIVSATGRLGAMGVAGPVAAFAHSAVTDAAERMGLPAERLEPDSVADWVGRQACPVVTAYPPVGPTAELLAALPLRRLRRVWDEAAWPHATRGFFAMRGRIPEIVGLRASRPGLPSRDVRRDPDM